MNFSNTCFIPQLQKLKRMRDCISDSVKPRLGDLNNNLGKDGDDTYVMCDRYKFNAVKLVYRRDGLGISYVSADGWIIGIERALVLRFPVKTYLGQQIHL